MATTPTAGLDVPDAAQPESAARVSERYATLFRAHYGKVVRWLEVLGLPNGAVDDVAQEVFIVAHRKLDQLRPDASAAAWLMGIARRVCATHRRGRQRARAREQHIAPPGEAPNPEAAAMRSEAAQLLAGFLGSLPDEQRLVFVMYEIDGSSAVEIAEALDIPRNTVHSRIRLIREKLARLVAREQAKDEGRHG